MDYLLSIKTFDKQIIVDKYQYSHVNTPFYIIEEMLDLLPFEIFFNKDYKWLDPGCGYGYFSIVLYQRLFKCLRPFFISNTVTHNHIVENMLYMVDINPIMVEYVKNLFGENANVICNDFVSWNTDLKFDFIIGNPPYVIGTKKVPTNNSLVKKNDGTTIWHQFIKKSINVLHTNGYLSFIIPCLWMRKDKANMYDYMNTYKIHYIKCFNNTQSNKIFNQQCQTPTSIFVLQNKLCKFEQKHVHIYDQPTSSYIIYRYSFGDPIPMFAASIIQELQPYVNKYGSLAKYVSKTNLPSSKIKIQKEENDTFKYKNIKTCLLDKIQPYLVYEYSDKPLPFYNCQKLVLAHKMYGFSYFDKNGEFGISSRDNYIIHGLRENELFILNKFFNKKSTIFLFECCRYRMKCIEKCLFELIPNILNMDELNFSIDFLFSKSSQKMKYTNEFNKNYNQI